MVNMSKRGFLFSLFVCFKSGGAVMLLRGRGTRRRPCDSRLECPPRSSSSRLGFCWRPLQKGMRPLHVWRVTTSVKSPYIPMLRIQFVAITDSSSKCRPCSKQFLTIYSLCLSLLPRESLLDVCGLPYMFSKHKNKQKFKK